MSLRNGWRIVMSFLAITGAVAIAHAQGARTKRINEALTFNADGALRSKEIHWPDGFHPEQADLFAHNEVVIHASCEKVFADMADAQAWPSWYPNSRNVKLLNSPDGKLHQGTRFSWDTFGFHFESRVHEFVPDSRIGWFEWLSHVPSAEDKRRLPRRDGRSCERAQCGRTTHEPTAGYARGTRSLVEQPKAAL
jgi:hypothetical protein